MQLVLTLLTSRVPLAHGTLLGCATRFAWSAATCFARSATAASSDLALFPAVGSASALALAAAPGLSSTAYVRVAHSVALVKNQQHVNGEYTR